MLDRFDKKKVIIIGVICVSLIIGAVVYYFFEYNNEDFVEFEDEMEIRTNEVENIVVEEKTKKIVVHISGQVINPGVITLKENSRIVDAINEAGGFTNLADLNKINLAYVLEDAQKIYIPSVNEEETKEYVTSKSGDEDVVTNGTNSSSTSKEKIMININTASIEELQKLSGVGESTATKIVNYRKENGKYASIEDIKNVSGIGESKFNKIKDYICVK